MTDFEKGEEEIEKEKNLKKYRPRDPHEKDHILGKTLEEKIASVIKIQLGKHLIGYGIRQSFMIS